MFKKYFIKLLAITIVVIYGNLCLTTANAAYPVLKLDVGADKDPTRIEPGFDVFTLPDSGSKIKGITVSIAPIEPNPPIQGNPATLSTRWRGGPTGIPCELIYRDFIFARPGGIRLTLSGFWPNEPYEITIWAFDLNSTTGGNRIADWYANGVLCLTTNFIGSTSPTDCSSHAFTGPAQSDSNGVIVLEAYPNPNTTEQSGANNPYAFIDGLLIASVNPILDATNPVPADGNTVPATAVQLSWTAGMAATSHRVYFGETFNDVNDANTLDTEYRGSTTNTFFSVGSAGQPYPTGLPADKTYYWRIDETDGVSIWKGKVWRFYVPPKTPYNPSPVNGALFADPNFLDPAVMLSWYKATNATSYNVYFGDNQQNVQNGTGDTDKGTVTDTSYDSNMVLQSNKTYYWRVDAFDGTTTHTGAVWSFKTSPADCGQIDMDIWENITGGSTLNLLTGDPRYPDSPTRTEKLTSFSTTNGVADNYGGRIHGWLYVPLTGDYRFYFTSAAQGQLWLSTDDDPNHLMPQPLASENVWGTYNDFSHISDPIPLIGGNKYYIRAIWKDVDWQDFCQVAWKGAGIRDQAIIRGCYLSPYAYYQAFDPYPEHGATEVEPTLTLTWKPGKYAAKHEVYFSDNFDAVNDANNSDPCGPGYVYKGQQNIDANSYGLMNLELGKTYYWRIDEVNTATSPYLWRGSIWSFTIRNFIPVDTFESYNNNIANTWKKGGGGTVGYSDPNKEELTIVHDGRRSMPFDYNNTNPTYSDANRTFTQAQNWTTDPCNIYSLKSLTLWLRGYMAPVGSLTKSGSTYTMTASGTDIWDVKNLRNSLFHDEFHYAYIPIDTANFDIIVKVESISNTNASAKAGVMIRDSTDADSTHAMVCITPSNGVRFQYRAAAGGSSTEYANDPNITVPYWLRLERYYDDTGGNYIYNAWYSSSGEDGSWHSLGNPDTTAIDMTSPVCIGLSLTAHNAAATCTAVFSNVSITQGGQTGRSPGAPQSVPGPRGEDVALPSPWTSHQDIGIKSNIAAPLYVTLQDSSTPPKTAKVTHPDPNIVLQTAWQEWNIALSEFKDKTPTLDLTKVKKITIGVGSNSTPVGTLYFDDIRLYRARCIPGTTAPDSADSSCVANYPDLQLLGNNWLINNYQVTPTSWNPDTDASLVAYYKFDGDFTDSSGKGHNGEPNGASIITDSIRGQVANFDGTNDYVSLPIGPDINSLTNSTFATWVNFSNGGGSWQRIFDFGSNTTVYMFLSPRGGTTGTSPMRFAITTSSAGGESQLNAPSTLARGWHHVAVVINGVSKTMQLCLDGVVVASGTTAVLPTDLGNTTNNWLGRSQWTADAYFIGYLDDFRIYNRALSHGEVASLAGKTGFTQPLYLLLTPQNSGINLYNDGRIDLKDYAILAEKWLEVLRWP